MKKHQLTWNEAEFPMASRFKDQTKAIRSRFTRACLLLLERELSRSSQPFSPTEQPQPTPPVTMDEELAAALKGWQL